MQPPRIREYQPLLALIALLAVLLAACGERPQGPPADAANVLLLSIDCLNQRQFTDAAAAGTMPRLAALAADSLAYERAYSHAPWTTPSHMSMLTGLYPSQHGSDVPWGLMIDYDLHQERVPEAPMLSELLAAAGYETAAFVGGATTSRRFGFERGFGTFEESSKGEAKTDLPVTVERFESWLDGRSAAETATPFFAFVHTFDLHRPWPAELEDEAAVLAYVDDHAGRVLTALERHGLLDSMLVVFTGDHGSKMIRVSEKCCVHGAGHYEENLKVPLLLKLPGDGPNGARNELARHIDILPTVLDALGMAFEAYRGEGVSLLAVERGEARVELSFSEADARCARRFGLVTATHKYIYTPQGGQQALLRGHPRFFDRPCKARCAELPAVEELFDLRDDPFEERSLAITAAQAGEANGDEGQRILRWFRQRMNEHLNLEPAYRLRVAVGTESSEIEPDVNEALRTLGYVN